MGNARNLGSLLNTNTTIQADDLNIGQLGNRNLIINGAMQVAQRGTSFTNVGGYLLDRWVVGNPGTNSVSQQYSSSLGMYYMDVTTSAAWGTYQWIENINARILKANDTVTVSYWTNVLTGNFNITTTNGSPVSYTTATIDSLSGWYRRSAVVTISSSQASDIASGGHLRLAIEPSSNNFYLTGVQLEVGDTATPFEHRSYGHELMLCQRYYFIKSYPNDRHLGNGRWEGSQVSGTVFFPQTMRTSPTVTANTTGMRAVNPTVAWYSINNLNSVHKTGTQSLEMFFAASASGDNKGASVIDFDTGGFVAFEAEL